jgi:hypothetical protein
MKSLKSNLELLIACLKQQQPTTTKNHTHRTTSKVNIVEMISGRLGILITLKPVSGHQQQQPGKGGQYNHCTTKMHAHM